MSSTDDKRKKLRFSTDGQPEAKASTDPVTIPPRVKHKTMDLARVVVGGLPVTPGAAAQRPAASSDPSDELRDSQVELPAGLPANKLQEVVFDAQLAAAFDQQLKRGESSAARGGDAAQKQGVAGGYGTPGPRRNRDIPTGPRLGNAANLPELKGEIVDEDATAPAPLVRPVGEPAAPQTSAGPAPQAVAPGDDHVMGPWAAAPALGASPGRLVEASAASPNQGINAPSASARIPAEPSEHTRTPLRGIGPVVMTPVAEAGAPAAEEERLSSPDERTSSSPPPAPVEAAADSSPPSGPGDATSPWAKPAKPASQPTPVDLPLSYVPPRDSAPGAAGHVTESRLETTEMTIPVDKRGRLGSTIALLGAGVVVGLGLVVLVLGRAPLETSAGETNAGAEGDPRSATGSQARPAGDSPSGDANANDPAASDPAANDPAANDSDGSDATDETVGASPAPTDPAEPSDAASTAKASPAESSAAPSKPEATSKPPPASAGTDSPPKGPSSAGSPKGPTQKPSASPPPASPPSSPPSSTGERPGGDKPVF